VSSLHTPSKIRIEFGLGCRELAHELRGGQNEPKITLLSEIDPVSASASEVKGGESGANLAPRFLGSTNALWPPRQHAQG
jgi:hypothetical protein